MFTFTFKKTLNLQNIALNVWVWRDLKDILIENDDNDFFAKLTSKRG
jgi:hypothetical protein